MNKFIIGIDLGGTNIKAAIFNSDLQLMVEIRRPTQAQKGPDHVLNKYKQIIDEMLENLNITDKSIYCMGMGIPGLLDPKQGISFFSPNFPGWENIQIVNELNKRFDFPIFIDNDVRVNLYGEWRFGAGLNIRKSYTYHIGYWFRFRNSY